MFKKYSIFVSLFFSICVLFSTLFKTNSNMYFPIKEKYILTSDYGYRSFDNSFHDGIDIVGYEGTAVYSLSSGIVTYSGFDISGGYMLIIKYDNGYTSMFCHLANNLKVKKGDRVMGNTCVGYIGPKYLEDGRLNGYTTGVHLHFSLSLNGKSVNPFSVKYT